MAHVSLSCPSLAKQLCSAPQLRGPLLPSLVIRASKAQPCFPHQGASFQHFQWKKLERNPAHLSTSISPSLTRELSDGGQVLNFCMPEPCVVQSKVNRFYGQREYSDHLIQPPASHGPGAEAVITPSFQ